MPMEMIKLKGFFRSPTKFLRRMGIRFQKAETYCRLRSNRKTGRKMLVFFSKDVSSEYVDKLADALDADGYQEGTEYVLLSEVERVYAHLYDCQPVPLAAA